MEIPSTATGLVILVLAVMPGIVYAAGRHRWHGIGPEDREIGARVLRAMMVSTALDCVYVIALGPRAYHLAHATDAHGKVPGLAAHSREVALWIFGGVFVVPLLLAALIYGFRVDLDSPPVRWLRQHKVAVALGKAWRAVRARVKRRRPEVDPTPTAWDWAAGTRGPSFVRVRLTDGHWVGGWIGKEMYCSTYPEPRDLFIGQQWEMGADGSFVRPIDNGRGLHLALTGAEIVDWVGPPDE